MATIQVGSITTTFDKDGNVKSVVKKPSYLILEDGTKVELSEEEAKKHGIGNSETEK